MSLTNQKILGISVTTNPKTEILEYVEKYLKQRQKAKGKRQNFTTKPFIIVTPNPEQVMMARRDSHFAGILNQADIAIPDGIGLVWASRIFSSRNPNPSTLNPLHKISGVELMEDLVAIAAKQGFPIALIGGRGGVALKAFECLQLRNSGLTGWAEEPGEIANTTNTANTTNSKYYQYCRSINQKIRTTETRIVFVGLGAPKQEYFIERLSLSLRGASVASDAAISKKGIATPRRAGSRDDNRMVLMSVGGAFDEISGAIPRAPLGIDRLGLKWLWRLIVEPWRWRRQLSLFKFIGLITKNVLNHNSI